MEVTLDTYHTLAMRTNSTVVGTHPMHPDIIHAALGLGDEILELADAIDANDTPNIKEEIGDLCWFGALYSWDLAPTNPILEFDPDVPCIDAFVDLRQCVNFIISNTKKSYAYGTQYKAENRARVSRSFFTFIQHLCDVYEFDFNEILRINIEKLQKRFPDKFTVDAATNRDLEGERKILEQ